MSEIDHHTLSIEGLKIWVRLGCTEQEKYFPQLVNFDITIFYASAPQELETDALSDAVCYREIVESVKQLCEDREFNLLEYLGNEVYKALVNSLSAKISNISSIKISTCKISSPVSGVHGGLNFTLHKFIKNRITK